ncbi:MAG: pre-peptidase C-terminal domain-containing protein [Planctomycetes bacterium]|nr:pre-peptidase C-terminal domain-containing protein [Planctomycetota bacterium]
MKRPITPGLAGLALTFLLTAAAAGREIDLGDVRITAPGDREGRSAITPWSGQWWPMSAGKLALGWNGTGNDFTYDPATKQYRRAATQKPAGDLSPFLKFDEWRRLVTGTDPGSALVELHGQGSFRHHVHGDEKERLDREGISYSWWGHCNGWCAAAILEKEPIGPVEARGVRFEVADLKGILSECHYGVESDFTGRRYDAPSAAVRESRETARRLLAALNGNQPAPVAEYVAWYEKAYSTTLSPTVRQSIRPSDFRSQLEYYETWCADRFDAAYADLAPHVFHQILESVIGQRRLSLVFDIDAGAEVWNHPAYAYTSSIERVRTFTEGNAQRTEWRARTVVTYATDGVSESILGVEGFTRTYTYTLITDAAGRPIGGEWTGASVDDHPDFAWLPTFNSAGADSSENPRMPWGQVTELLAADHLATTARAFDLEAQGVAASSRRAAGNTTTWEQPIAVQGDAALAVRVRAGQAVARVTYHEQRLNTSGAHPTVRRDPLVALGESTTTPRFEVTARLATGKRMILAYAYDAAGRLLGVDEVTLDVGAAPAPRPTDDVYEPNNTAATAARIAPGVYRDLVCNDDDWFSVVLTSPGSLSVTIDFRHAEGDLDLHVDGPSGRVGRSESTSDRERVEVASVPAGTYLIRVFGYQGARARYTLTVATTPAASTGPADDRFEPNNTRAAAAAIAPGSYPGLVCNDDDWFKVTLGAEATLEVRIAFRHAEGDLDMSVSNAAGTVLRSSTSSADGELIRLERQPAGDYFVRVYGYRGARAGYDLTVTVTPTATTVTPPPATTTTGTVTATALNVRRGPGTTFAIVTTLRQNAVVTILEERSGWLRVTWTGAPAGELWVSASFVRR